MSETLKTAVIILHYGDPGLTRRVHDQLLLSDPGLEDHILVLDNNAPEKYSQAWIRLPQNLFWAGALEWTARQISSLGYTHLWFLNNDILFDVTPPIIVRAVKRMAWIEKQLGKVGIYSPSVLSNPYHPQMVQNRKHQFRKVCYIDGIAPLINLECWFSLQNLGIDENPIGYGVDNYFSLQADALGWNVVVDQQVAIKHEYHSTARTVEGFLDQAFILAGSYLRRRIGPGSRARLENLAGQYTDY
ncbi:hypothetical protein [Desulfonatronovibrio hydrogenovorans]|uniref:hypothetical protein n=1 Tax=Desulfonatronovibrio hydrogenovorans TaxID=53245 RepID=UPI00054E2056|nr:hypothetical protein [Desulfonatronovibrio hydrogenovorans]